MNFTIASSDADAIEGRLQHVYITDLLEGTPFSGTDYSFEEKLSLVFQEQSFVFVENTSQATIPPEFRVNGVVSNMPEFAKAFSCKEGKPMAPVKRCAVW